MLERAHYCGDAFTIRAERTSEANSYVQSAALDGAAFGTAHVSHAAVELGLVAGRKFCPVALHWTWQSGLLACVGAAGRPAAGRVELMPNDAARLLKTLAQDARQHPNVGIDAGEAAKRAGLDLTYPASFWDTLEGLAGNGEVVIVTRFVGPSAEVLVTPKGMRRAETL